MARDPQFVSKYLEEVEELAEDVLADKQQIVSLDKKRNSNREALAALHKEIVAPPYSANKDDAVTMLRSDQDELKSEIDRVRRDLKPKVNKLRDAQNQPELQGFDLDALSAQEMRQVVPNQRR